VGQRAHTATCWTKVHYAEPGGASYCLPMNTNAPRKVWHLDPEGRLSPQAGDRDWRVVADDQSRVDPAAEYLFCAPDFLFPVNSGARALRLEVDPQPARAQRAARSARR
jgi:hypothetical protein